jgi:small conductance mechanosensitive channel
MDQIRLDVYTGIVILSVLATALIVARVVRWLINQAYKRESRLIKVDQTTYKFVKNAISFIIWLISIAVIAMMIPQLKALAVALFAGAGILFAIAGFAAQSAFSNIIAGIFMVIFKPFRVGDLIKVGDRDRGIVEDITLRHTIIVNFENKRIVIPNSVISNETVVNDNITDKKTCKFIEVGVSYDSDLEMAIKIMQDVSAEHRDFLDNRSPQELIDKEHPVEVRVLKFDDFSVNIRAFVWTADPLKAFKMGSDIMRAIKIAYDKAGIEIPYPYRTVVYKTDLDKAKADRLKNGK